MKGLIVSAVFAAMIFCGLGIDGCFAGEPAKVAQMNHDGDKKNGLTAKARDGLPAGDRQITINEERVHKKGRFVHYGRAINTVSTYAGLFTQNEEGNKVYYGVTRSGRYCRLFRFNVVARAVDMVAPITAAKGAWAIGLHDNSLYIGTYNPAALYRFDTQTRLLSHIATFKHEQYIWDMEIHNGTVYMGTYPHARVICYNLKTGNIRDLGSFSREKYVRSLTVHNDTIYAGIGARAQLIAYNMKTGRSKDILPQEFGHNSFVYHQVLCGSKLFLGLSPSYDILMYDIDTGKFTLLMEAANRQTGITKPTFSPGVIHFTGLGGYLFEYDSRKKSLKKLLPRTAQGIRNGTHIVAGEYIAGVDARAIYEEISFDGLLRKRTSFMVSGLPGIESMPFSLAAHNSVVFIGERMLRVFDITANTESYKFILGEPKTICILDNVLYTANYAGATLWRYPIEALVDSEYEDFDDPDRFMILDIEACQNRPKIIVSNEVTKSLLIGTQPDYGASGGALTYFNTSDGKSYTVRNIVPNHTIREIVFDSTDPEMAYIGTSVYGGTGSDPLDEDAHILKWSINNKSIVFDVVPENQNRVILSMAHWKNRLYAVTSKHNLLLMNSETGRILSTNKLLRLNKIMMTADGTLYGISKKRFYRIDSDTLEAECLKDDFADLHKLTEDKMTRKIFFIDGYDLLSYTPMHR